MWCRFSYWGSRWVVLVDRVRAGMRIYYYYIIAFLSSRQINRVINFSPRCEIIGSLLAFPQYGGYSPMACWIKQQPGQFRIGSQNQATSIDCFASKPVTNQNIC